eukprot:298_1
MSNTEQSNDNKDNDEFPHVGSVNITLDFTIDEKGQQDINKFGYHFDKTGCCLLLQTNQRPKKFETSTRFEEFGALIEKYIFYLLQHQYKLIPICIKSLDKEQTNNETVSKMKKKKKKKNIKQRK